MTVTALSGPFVQYGVTMTASAGTGLLGADMEHNPSRAPMVSDLGDAMLDPRVAYAYAPGSGVTVRTMGFANNVGNVDFVPITANTCAFVTSSYTSSAVSSFTLTAASSSGGTYSTTIIAPETGKATGTLIAIDSTAAYLTFGSDGTIAVWNPAAGTGRTVSITTSSTSDLGSFTVAGRDMYGYKVSEQIAISAATTGTSGFVLAGKKAFKYVSAITNCSAPGSTGVTIGFADTFGFPLAVSYVGLNTQVALESSANNFGSSQVVTLSTGTTVLASTTTATATTGDVRGTYASTTATNGVIRLQMIVTPTAAALATVSATNVAPLFGLTQYSSV